MIKLINGILEHEGFAETFQRQNNKTNFTRKVVIKQKYNLPRHL